MKHITPCLWFDKNAEEAVNFYLSVFKNSKIKTTAYYGEAASKASGQPKGSVLTIHFELNGQEFMALNGGPVFKFNEAVSFMVMCEDQKEIDHYWNSLTSGGGQESQCGWLKDKFGVSWQIVPVGFDEMLRAKDTKTSERVMNAMLQMTKMDIQKLKNAYEGA